MLVKDDIPHHALRRPVRDEMWVEKCKNPYFQRTPLITKRTILSLPLIPLFPANKGIRENEKFV